MVDIGSISPIKWESGKAIFDSTVKERYYARRSCVNRADIGRLKATTGKVATKKKANVCQSEIQFARNRLVVGDETKAPQESEPPRSYTVVFRGFRGLKANVPKTLRLGMVIHFA